MAAQPGRPLCKQLRLQRQTHNSGCNNTTTSMVLRRMANTGCAGDGPRTEPRARPPTTHIGATPDQASGEAADGCGAEKRAPGQQNQMGVAQRIRCTSRGVVTGPSPGETDALRIAPKLTRVVLRRENIE